MNKAFLLDTFFFKIHPKEKGETMIEHDTVCLLKECDAGIQMALNAIDEVSKSIQNPQFLSCLLDFKQEHIVLAQKVKELLKNVCDDGKEPGNFANVMSQIKTQMKIAMNECDETIADLLVDGAHMGIKSLSKYLNEYSTADETSKGFTKDLIAVEENFALQLRKYL